MSVHKIHEYRRAKQIVKDLERILKILSATEASLTNYAVYTPVRRILSAVVEYKPLLEIHLEQQKIVVETKGEQKR